MNFTDLLDRLELPPTSVAETAWEEGRRRVLRRRGAAAAGAASLAVACVVGIVVVTSPRQDKVPSPAPSPTESTEPRTAPLVQRLLTGGRWRLELVDMDYGRFSGNYDGAVPLSSAPVGRASLAIGDPRDKAGALVLGEDGTWRRVDVAGLVPVTDESGYTSPVVRPTSLSPDATHLALPQPNALVLVDLTDGSSRRYDVPGPANTYAIWADDEHVLVAEELAVRGTMVDLRDGTTRPSAHGPSTAFLGDATLTWARNHDLDSVLQWGDGRHVRTPANNAGGFFPQPPLVRDNVVVGLGGVVSSRDPELSLTVGIEIVDGSTGNLLAYLPLTKGKGSSALLFGWDGDRPIVGVPLPQESSGLFVFTWDWHQGELHPVGHVPEWTSWGAGDLH